MDKPSDKETEVVLGLELKEGDEVWVETRWMVLYCFSRWQNARARSAATYGGMDVATIWDDLAYKRVVKGGQ